MKLEKLLEKEIRNRSWKVLAENLTAKMEVGKMFALKFFSESKQKLETETKSYAQNGNWQSLLAQVNVCNQHITAVKRNGAFGFS